jgi:hypothetical protein
MNAKYLLASSSAAGLLKTNPRYRHAESLPGNELYENLTVLPRYFLVNGVRQASMEEAQRLIGKGAVDLHRTALIDQAVPLQGTGAQGAKGDIRTVRYEPDSLELEVTAGGESFLVLSESFYPGWRAWVDDRTVEIYRTDVAFRGMVVPAGKHRVRMEFHPVIFFVSLGLSMFSAVLVMVIASTGRGGRWGSESTANVRQRTQRLSVPSTPQA